MLIFINTLIIFIVCILLFICMKFTDEIFDFINKCLRSSKLAFILSWLLLIILFIILVVGINC